MKRTSRNESGSHKELIGHGVQQNANTADLSVLAGEIAVQAVSDGGQNEYARGQQFLLAARKHVCRENPDQEWNAANSA